MKKAGFIKISGFCAMLCLMTLGAPFFLGAQEAAEVTLNSPEDLLNLESVDTSPPEDSRFALSGFLKEELAYSFRKKEPDFAKMRTILNLTLDIDLFTNWKARINWNGFYDYVYAKNKDKNIPQPADPTDDRDSKLKKFYQDVRDAYERESEIREFYVDGSPTDWLQIKLGRQIIAWGESEGTQINDLANPRDMREPGLVDIENARIPVAALKLAVYGSSWETDLVIQPEIRFNKLPAPGSEFDLFESIRLSSVMDLMKEEKPANGAENAEYLFRFLKTFNGADLSLIGADVYSDMPYLDFYEIDFAAGISTLVPRHERIRSIGLAGNKVNDSWLFKGEFAHKTNVAIQLNQTEIQRRIASMTSKIPLVGLIFKEKDITEHAWVKKNIQQLMLGFDFSGLSDTSISLEASAERILDWEETLSEKKVSGMVSAMLSYAAMNNTLKYNLMLARLSHNNGDIYRVSVDYDPIDAMKLTGGFILYETTQEEAVYYQYRDNDRVFLEARYSF